MGLNKNKKHGIGFKYAISGIWEAFKAERNLKIHVIAIVAVAFLMIWLSTSVVENVLLVLTIGLVVAVELINTAIEKAVNISCDDILSKELKKDPVNNNAKLAKDVAAGAVLFTAITAVVVGIIIFLPKIIAKF